MVQCGAARRSTLLVLHNGNTELKIFICVNRMVGSNLVVIAINPI
jgi:hypothetical protein